MKILACTISLFVLGCGDGTAGDGDDLGMNGGGHDLAIKKGDMAGQPPSDMTGQPPQPDMAMAMTGKFTTVVTVVLENTSYTDIVGNMQNAPYINSLIAQGGLATNYMDSKTHPSLPNYLYMVSGATQYGGLFDYPTMMSPFPVDADNLGEQLVVAGVPWRAYMESMGSPCLLTDNLPYATKHNPFVYFKYFQVDNVATCKQVDVDYTALANDLASNTPPKFIWVTPNLNSDGHDTNLKTADTWCSTNVQAILDSAVFKAGGVLFLTWDEGSSPIVIQTDDHVPMIIVSPKIKQAGFTSATAYTHASYLRTVEDIFGLPALGAAAQAQNMNEFFQ